MNKEESMKKAGEHFAQLVGEQYDRAQKLKADTTFDDFSKIRPLRIGFEDGDGIGPIISKETKRIVEFLLNNEIKRGEIVLVDIEGFTIENRIKQRKAIPDNVLEKIKTCPIHLKAPTETPQTGDYVDENGSSINIESANVMMRKALDLCANIRPVKIPKEGIDWTFFRENTEGEYALGSRGMMFDDMAFDFKVFTRPAVSRLIRMGFEYAKKNNKPKVTAVTKANIFKSTDSMWLEIFRNMAKEYPGIATDEWFIDITTAKLLDPKRRKDFSVFVLPNLYGDIITDEAAELQGGVGTAGSANVGQHYAMFEAIHGSGTRMMKEGRGQYADPSSMIRSSAMMFEYIGYPDKAIKLSKALDITGLFEKKIQCTGRSTGATASQMSDYIMETIEDSNLEDKWRQYTKNI